MYPFTTDCNKLSSTCSYVVGGIRMTHLIHVLCASCATQGSHGGAVLLDHWDHSPLTVAVAFAVAVVVAIAAIAAIAIAIAVTVESLRLRRGLQVHCAQRREQQCLRSICHNGVVINDNAANGAPNAEAMLTLPDGGGGVGGGKNRVGGGSTSTDRDKDGHDADGDCRRHCCRHPRPRRAVTAVAIG